MTDTKTYDGLSSLVFLVGIYEGVLPFVGKLFGWHLKLALPLQLDGPWWWLVSIAVLIVAVALLERIDRAKKRAANG